MYNGACGRSYTRKSDRCEAEADALVATDLVEFSQSTTPWCARWCTIFLHSAHPLLLPHPADIAAAAITSTAMAAAAAAIAAVVPAVSAEAIAIVFGVYCEDKVSGTSVEYFTLVASPSRVTVVVMFRLFIPALPPFPPTKNLS
eukprot:GHVT01094413.1.p1 GENE.GHVT01094413.1~~GHVT01094413.1.p1  ORF type:complete len:144 (+),score=19.19 GHVT01094413.1:106-537(+)